MPDEFDQLAERLLTELSSVPWADADEIRRRGRRRRLRSQVTNTIAIVAIVAALTALLPIVIGRDRLSMPTGGIAPVRPMPLASGGRKPTTEFGPDYPGWIPAEAMLRPEDVGLDAHGYHIDTYMYGTESLKVPWRFSIVCPSVGRSDRTTWSAVTFLRGYTATWAGDTSPPAEGAGIVDVQVNRYHDPGQATQVVADVDSAVAECRHDTSTGLEGHPNAHANWAWIVRDRNFAGDQSLLISERVDIVDDTSGQQVAPSLLETFAVVRVADLVSVVTLSIDDLARVRTLAIATASRLCTASHPRC
jgi:hypothetical protein